MQPPPFLNTPNLYILIKHHRRNPYPSATQGSACVKFYGQRENKSTIFKYTSYGWKYPGRVVIL